MVGGSQSKPEYGTGEADGVKYSESEEYENPRGRRVQVHVGSVPNCEFCFDIFQALRLAVKIEKCPEHPGKFVV
ncbi:hypothetical protein RUM44_003705 [Polyplax serrata]|uniref:Uncharacterized protein n=1 Tax=Polyplax serrata TaxID=468196 RepID=A0ABR1AIV9_POLSC